MDGNTELLQFVNKNAQMGMTTIPKVMGLVRSPGMRSVLDRQLREYTEIAGDAEREIERRGGQPHGPGKLSEAMSDLMLRAKTVSDRSPSHIAEMMIRGSTMGTVQMVRRIHGCRDRRDREALALADRLLKTEENNIQQLKRFL